MNLKLKYQDPNRLHAIDEFRGVCLVLMVLYHFVYDVISIYNIDFPFFYSNNMNLFRDLFAGVFILIAGISRNLSHNNYKNAAKILFGALIVTIVTSFLGTPILFGILHFMGIAILCSNCFLPWLKKIPAAIFYPIAVLCILLFKNIPNGYLGIKGFWVYSLPRFLYIYKWLSPLGFASPDFVSYDYFPIIPWLFVFLLGMYLGRNFKYQAPTWVKKSYIPFLQYIGSYSLLIYLLHQPVVYGLVELSHFLYRNL